MCKRFVPEDRILDQQVVARFVEVFGSADIPERILIRVITSVGGSREDLNVVLERHRAIVVRAADRTGVSVDTVLKQRRFLSTNGGDAPVVETRIDRQVDGGAALDRAADGAVDRLGSRSAAVSRMAGVVHQFAPNVVVCADRGVVERTVEVLSVDNLGARGGIVDPGDRMDEVLTAGNEEVTVDEVRVLTVRAESGHLHQQEVNILVDIGVNQIFADLLDGVEFEVIRARNQIRTAQDRNDLAVDVERHGQFIGRGRAGTLDRGKVGHVLVVLDTDAVPTPLGIILTGSAEVRIIGEAPTVLVHVRIGVARLGRCELRTSILDRTHDL